MMQAKAGTLAALSQAIQGLGMLTPSPRANSRHSRFGAAPLRNSAVMGPLDWIMTIIINFPSLLADGPGKDSALSQIELTMGRKMPLWRADVLGMVGHRTRPAYTSPVASWRVVRPQAHTKRFATRVPSPVKEKALAKKNDATISHVVELAKALNKSGNSSVLVRRTTVADRIARALVGIGSRMRPNIVATKIEKSAHAWFVSSAGFQGIKAISSPTAMTAASLGREAPSHLNFSSGAGPAGLDAGLAEPALAVSTSLGST
mmetsp:Transcript_1945/g.4794  ORF Transcript_1945/g.4794 Transcript_1945/m.4794 type:complete len:261 (+) Transcript_1945:898-1680(+)